MRQVTAEFGDELDQLRGAPDFTDASVEILISALKQGEMLYDEEAKKEIERALREDEEGAS